MPHTPENGYNQAMTEAELRKIVEYVDEIVHGLHEWDYRHPFLHGPSLPSWLKNS